MQIQILEGKASWDGTQRADGAVEDVSVAIPADLLDDLGTDDGLLEVAKQNESRSVEVVADSDHCVVGVKAGQTPVVIRVFEPYCMESEDSAILSLKPGREMFLKARGKGLPVVELYGG